MIVTGSGSGVSATEPEVRVVMERGSRSHGQRLERPSSGARAGGGGGGGDGWREERCEPGEKLMVVPLVVVVPVVAVPVTVGGFSLPDSGVGASS